jgi:hypothetical protein
MALKLGYKVLFKAKKAFFSISKGKDHYSIDSIVTPYPLGDWAIPKLNNGPLTVLSSRKAARHLRDTIGYSNVLTIKRCLYEPSKEKYVWAGEWKRRTPKDLEDSSPMILLKGTTRLADKVLIF